MGFQHTIGNRQNNNFDTTSLSYQIQISLT